MSIAEVAEALERSNAQTRAAGVMTADRLAYFDGVAQGLRAAEAMVRTSTDRERRPSIRPLRFVGLTRR